MERVVLAFSREETANKIKHMLDGSGYEVCAVCRTASELLRYTADYDASLVIMGYKLGGELADTIADDLPHGTKLMAIVRAENSDLISNEEIFVLTLPVDRRTLLSSAEIFLGAINKNKKTRRDPEEQKVIDEAKLWLMEKYRMTEEQAHRFIQKRSMDTGAKFIDTARLILHI